jgi:hypothetical protein
MKLLKRLIALLLVATALYMTALWAEVVSRLTTWQTGDVIEADAFNAEFDNLVNALNGAIDKHNIDSTALIVIDTLAIRRGIKFGTGHTATLGNILWANGTMFIPVTKDSAGIVDETSRQTITGVKIFSDSVTISGMVQITGEGTYSATQTFTVAPEAVGVFPTLKWQLTNKWYVDSLHTIAITNSIDSTARDSVTALRSDITTLDAGQTIARDSIQLVDDSLTAKFARTLSADTLGNFTDTTRFKADSARVRTYVQDTVEDSLAEHKTAIDSINLNVGEKPDTSKFKTGFNKFYTGSVLDSITVDASGGGYMDYWNVTPSDTLTILYSSATDIDLPSVAWPGKPTGATIYKAYPIIRFLRANSLVAESHNIDEGTLRAKHPAGAWGVDDVMGLKVNGTGVTNTTGFFRFSTATPILQSTEIIGGKNISSILADTAHAVNFQLTDVQAFSGYSGNINQVIVQTGLRVFYGQKPHSEIVWGYNPSAIGNSAYETNVFDSLTVSIPDGATIDKAYLLVRNICNSTEVDTALTQADTVKINKAGGGYAPGIVLRFDLMSRMYRVKAGFGSIGDTWTGGADLSATVTGNGDYSFDIKPSVMAGYTSVRSTWQGGLLLTYTY